MTISTFFEDGPTLLQSMIAGLGILFVIYEIRRNTRLSKGRLIFDFNQQLASYHDLTAQFPRLQDEKELDAMDEITKERLFDYISVFETIEGMCQMKMLSISEVDYYFSGRLAYLIGSRTFREKIFYDEKLGGQLYPIFSLVRRVITWRNKLGRAGTEADNVRFACFLEFRDHDIAIYRRLSCHRLG